MHRLNGSYTASTSPTQAFAAAPLQPAATTYASPTPTIVVIEFH
jgi:hypothetical protein